MWHGICPCSFPTEAAPTADAVGFKRGAPAAASPMRVACGTRTSPWTAGSREGARPSPWWLPAAPARVPMCPDFLHMSAFRTGPPWKSAAKPRPHSGAHPEMPWVTTARRRAAPGGLQCPSRGASDGPVSHGDAGRGGKGGNGGFWAGAEGPQVGMHRERSQPCGPSGREPNQRASSLRHPLRFLPFCVQEHVGPALVSAGERGAEQPAERAWPSG